MAFFKFRKGGDDQTTAAAPPESIEALRKRARHRLIGTAILVLIGVIGFPLLVDKQPRPIEVNIPIEIPDKDKVKPLVAPVVTTPAPAASAPQATASAAGVIGEAAAPAPAAASKPADKTSEKAPERPASKPAARPESKAPKAAASDDRFVVQVGAFADVNRARDARLKLERSGLKTYTQVVESKDGRRIRVRVGPYASKAQADKAAEKIRKLDLPAAVLSL